MTVTTRAARARVAPHPDSAPAAPAAPAPHPFLKWAGGKGQLLPELLARVPERIDTYYEPFIGGGALFFALMANPTRRPRRAVLNDLNADLVTTYEVVRDASEALAERLASLEARYLAEDAAGREAAYYAVRAERPTERMEVAARVIFLNRTCFNGLYRVNRRGEFNVPHGRYRAPRILDRPGLLAASEALRDVELRNADFAEACADARSGDFVYLDPPFHPLSATSSFTGYTESAFGKAEQLRLKRCIDVLTGDGVRVLLSNSGHQWVVGVYESGGYPVEEIPARRAINSRGDRRGPISELVITNDPSATIKI
ncbi:MAG: DNA adenine methylase [Chloroflexi bacterium]|nr:MAG: DNA adenine methylase [Chloroflexota bacterium]